MTTRDQLRLALAQSLMQGGGAPGSPLGLFGNLARQAAGFQLQKKALDDIEARKQAASQRAIAALTPQPQQVQRLAPAVIGEATDEIGTPRDIIGAKVVNETVMRQPGLTDLLPLLQDEDLPKQFSSLVSALAAREATPETFSYTQLADGTVLETSSRGGRARNIGKFTKRDFSKLIDPATGKVNPTVLEAQKQIRAAGVAQAINPYDQEAAKQAAKSDNEYYSKLGEKYDPTMANNYRRMLEITRREGFQPASFTNEFVSALRVAGLSDQTIKDLTGKIGDNQGNTAEFTTLLNDAVLRMQLLQKGPQTENDARRLQASILNINAPIEKIQVAIRARIANEEFNKYQIKFADNFVETNQTKKGLRPALRRASDFRTFISVADASGNQNFVFWNEYVERYRAENPEATEAEALADWKRVVQQSVEAGGQ